MLPWRSSATGARRFPKSARTCARWPLDLSTQAKVDEAKSLRHRLIGQPRADARKTSKELKSKLAQVSKAIGAREDEIVKAWDEAETLITPQIESRQTALDAEKAERQRIEREAAEAHAARLAAIATFAERSREPGMTAERIGKGMLILTETDVADEDKTRAVELADAQCRALEVMRTLHAQAVSREAEAARQEAQRLENERVAAELAAERARIAEEAAEIRRQAAALEAARAAEIVRENQRRAAEEAAARAESERLEALAVANREHLAREAEELARARATVTWGGPEPIAPDDPDAEPPMTAEQMGAEKPEQLDDAALTPPLRGIVFKNCTFEPIDGKTAIKIELGGTITAAPQPEPQSAALADLQALATEARASRFPSQPKMGTEWWSRFYAAADALKERI